MFYLNLKKEMKQFSYLFILLCCFMISHCRIHRLTISDDYRTYIALTSFGFYEGGHLSFTLSNFSYKPIDDALFGFTLQRIFNKAIDHMEPYKNRCILGDAEELLQNNDDIVFFIMDFKNNVLRINCSAHSNINKLRIYENSKSLPVTSLNDHVSMKNENYLDFEKDKNLGNSTCVNLSLQMSILDNLYKTQVVMYVPTQYEEGRYELFFHNCANYEDKLVENSFLIEIEEYNVGNYLSAGEMPLPTLYFIMSMIFFTSALFWIYILVKSRHPVFKIHYLMGTLVILKSMGLLFHGINFHFIEIKGEHVATWAILYYVTHLLKGSVLFITIILIGTGWTFIKHILSPKDKKIFMIVIPLQVFANVAEIIIEESEEGDAEHKMWLDVFTFVDLICCVAILFPILWSIKHLQDASQTDGKAAINLRKLKLFRHFYVMILCYIYFTRLVVYLLKMTAPFEFEWLDEMFNEVATFIFFVLTGYKFRPASANPYFQVADEDDEEIDIVVNQCGFTEGLTKLNRISNESGKYDKDSLLISKRECSHDYD